MTSNESLQVVLSPIASADGGNAFATKLLELKPREIVKIGRKVSAKVPPAPGNAIFDSKVLSRSHAELWVEQVNDVPTVMIRDSGSSNGTFVNGIRLSEEGQVSEATALHSGDQLDFGVDIMDDGKLLFARISCKVSIGNEAEEAWRSRTIPAKPESEQSILDRINRQIALSNRTQAQLHRLHEVFALFMD